MTKKITAIILTLIMTLSLFACGAGDIDVALDTKMPWETSGGNETCTYTVEKHARKASGKTTVNGDLVASGTAVYALNAQDDKTTTLVTTFSITYTDSPECVDTDFFGHKYINNKCTDKITSTVVFNKTLIPLSSTKTITFSEREPGVTQKKGSQPVGYTYTVDYDKRVAKIKLDNEKPETTINLESGARYDNEEMFYLIRAMSNLKPKSQVNFYNTNAYSMYSAGKYIRHNMNVSVAEKTSSVRLSEKLNDDKFKIKDTEGPVKPNEDKSYNINCLDLTITKTDKPSGPPIKALIADPSYEFAADGLSSTTKKLIIEMLYVEYDLNASERYNTKYTLSDYTTTKAA